MADDTKGQRLGRGLSALLGDTEFETGDVQHKVGAPAKLPIEFLQPNPFQPRKNFEQTDLDELTASIKEKGVLQPIVVRPIASETDRYQIVAGERRWRAAQRAGIHEIPIIIRELSDSEALEISIIENVQRTDLNSMEEAAGYTALIKEFKHTQEQLAEAIGKSRSHVANTLRLMTLPDRLQGLIRAGKLSAGHGRALLASADADALADRIVKEDLNVRQAEALAKGPATEAKQDSDKARRSRPEKDPDTLALENSVSSALGLKVTVNHHGEDGGDVKIAYKTLEQLDEICRRLGREA